MEQSYRADQAPVEALPVGKPDSEAVEYAREMQSIWGNDQEQIECHMESEGFSPIEIVGALDALGIFQPLHRLEIVAPV